MQERKTGTYAVLAGADIGATGMEGGRIRVHTRQEQKKFTKIWQYYYLLLPFTVLDFLLDCVEMAGLDDL